MHLLSFGSGKFNLSPNQKASLWTLLILQFQVNTVSVALFCGSCHGAECSRSWTWGTRRTSWRRFEEIILADEENTSKTFETQKQKTTHKECFSIKRANRNCLTNMLITLQWTVKIKNC